MFVFQSRKVTAVIQQPRSSIAASTSNHLGFVGGSHCLTTTGRFIAYARKIDEGFQYVHIPWPYVARVFSQAINSRTMNEGPDWYDTADSKATHSRGDLQELVFFYTLVKNAIKDAAERKDDRQCLERPRSGRIAS